MDELTKRIIQLRKKQQKLDAEILRLTNESLKRFNAVAKKPAKKKTAQPTPTDEIKIKWV